MNVSSTLLSLNRRLSNLFRILNITRHGNTKIVSRRRNGEARLSDIANRHRGKYDEYHGHVSLSHSATLMILGRNVSLDDNRRVTTQEISPSNRVPLTKFRLVPRRLQHCFVTPR